jgi:N-succinyldiaminopimelate aminotransferase
VSGPPELVAATRAVKQHLSYSGGTPFQAALATVLDDVEPIISDLRGDLSRQRDLLCAGLATLGLEVRRPAGTYFVVADVAPLGATDGVAFCRSLPERAGVVAVPTQVFYADPDDGRTLVRFAFCKRPQVLAEAVDRLHKAFR